LSAPPRLLLLGCVHLDPWGPEKLRDLLALVQPDIVTVEISRWGLVFRARHGAALRARLAAACEAEGGPPCDRALALQRMLDLPYELRAAQDYARARPGVRVVPVDLSEPSYRRLAALDEVFEPENLRDLVADREYSLTRAAIEQTLMARRYQGDDRLFAWHFRDEDKREMTLRGRTMARGIAGQLARWPSAKLVHVGGWAHLVPSRAGGLMTLVEALRDEGLRPSPLLLGDRPRPPWAPPEES